MQKPITGTWFEFWHHNIPEGKYWNPICRHFSAEQWGAKVDELASVGMKYIVLMATALGYEEYAESYFDTDEFYNASREANYVKVVDIARNIAWTTDTQWGELQITINLSKPEKDPRAIAAAAKKKADDSYVDPATGRTRSCPLCVCDADLECGYARKIPIGGETWGMWYSPYAYYNEHCIAMSWEHRPMHIDRAAFECLLDFVDLFPSYFIGSNADIPIVGGSILSHDHFQGGRHTFPMEVAPVVETFDLPAFPSVEAGIV